LRPQGLPMLSLTFSTYEEAEEWVEEHEQRYIDDPERYQEWIKLNRLSIKENAILHVHIPLDSF
jgi:hypothetical protein